MKNLIYIFLFLPFILIGQNIVQNGNYNESNTRFEKALIEAVVKNVTTGENQKVTPPTQWTVSDFDKIEAVDTITFRSGLSLMDSVNYAYQKSFKMQRIRTFGNIEFNDMENPFLPVGELLVYGLSDTDAYCKALLTNQNRVKSIKVNGQDYTGWSDNQAVQEADNRFRQVKRITGLKSNTVYMVTIEYENDRNEIIEAFFNFRTN